MPTMEYIIIVIVFVFLEVFVKIGCLYYEKSIIKERQKVIENIKVIDSDISYSEYIRIANKASTRNAPIRLKGDFWDFILPNANCKGTNNIETQIANADCEENNI